MKKTNKQLMETNQQTPNGNKLTNKIQKQNNKQ